nr:DUF4116 domain-containing protein [uncultured Fusobacterium sp.]
MTGWENKNKVLKAVKEDGLLLKYASETLRNDRELVIEAIKNNDWALEFASDELKKDFLICVMACLKKSNKNLMRFISPELKSNRYFILTLVLEDISFFSYCDKSLKADKEFILEVIKRGKKSASYNIYTYISKTLRKDKDIIFEGIKHKLFHTYNIPLEFRDNKEIMIELIKIDSSILEYASDRLKDNEKIVKLAIENNPFAILYASDRLQRNKKLLLKAVKINGEVLSELPTEILNNVEIVDDKILEEAVKTYPDIQILIDQRQKSIFHGLEDRGIGYLGVLELLFKEIESYGEEIEERCCLYPHNWEETKKIYIEYYTKDLMESNYLWSCIVYLANELSEALKYN